MVAICWGRPQTAVLGLYGEGPCGYRSNWGNATRDWGRNGNQNPMAMRSRSDFPCRQFQAIPSWMVFSTRYFRPSTSPRGKRMAALPWEGHWRAAPVRGGDLSAFIPSRSVSNRGQVPEAAAAYATRRKSSYVGGTGASYQRSNRPLASTFCPDPTRSNNACQSAHTTCVKLNLSGGHAHRTYRPFSLEVV